MAILPSAGEFGRGLRDPLVMGGLIIALLPLGGVVALGWGALALVVLYWMENAAIGLATMVRMVLVGLNSPGESPLKGIGSALFFAFHYGMFWVGHGLFIIIGSGLARESRGSVPVEHAEFLHAIDVFWALVVLAFVRFAWEILLAVVDWGTGRLASAKIEDEMSAPYTRLAVLHVGIVLSGFVAVNAGDPAAFTLAIILGYAAWTFVQDIRRRVKTASGAI